MSLIYAGLGSRNTPDNILQAMEAFAGNMAERGHALRTGAAPKGPDSYLERGCESKGGTKEIFLPWPGYNMRWNSALGTLPYSTEEGMDIARANHFQWHEVNMEHALIYAGISHILLGWYCNRPADFLICWGAQSPITAQAIRVADAYKIPYFDLEDSSSFERLEEFPGI